MFYVWVGLATIAGFVMGFFAFAVVSIGKRADDAFHGDQYRPSDDDARWLR